MPESQLHRPMFADGQSQVAQDIAVQRMEDVVVLEAEKIRLLPQPVQQKERADTAKRAPAESAQQTEAEKVTYEVTTTEERIKNKLEEWVEEKGYENNGITINDLSKRIGINRTYLSRYINENYSCNFNCWINKLRVSEAERIMRLQPDLSLSEIAEQVGYADISHFSKMFKAIKGDSPSAYEKKIRQNTQLSKRTQ